MIRASTCLLLLAAFILASPPASSDEPPAPPPSLDIGTRLSQAREHMRSLEYEQAIALLEPVLEATRFQPERLRETYLLLVEAHVYRGNLSPSGTKEQQLWYEAARDLIRECLGVPELRQTYPHPPERFPIEMLEFFDELRRALFGSFEVALLDPPDAEVIFDGETLEPLADGTRRAVNVPVGTHVLLVRRDGYQAISEDVEITPAIAVTRSVVLPRDRGIGWYATRIVVPVAAVAGIVAVGLTSGEGEGADLPGPPPPPVLP